MKMQSSQLVATHATHALPREGNSRAHPREGIGQQLRATQSNSTQLIATTQLMLTHGRELMKMQSSQFVACLSLAPYGRRLDLPPLSITYSLYGPVAGRVEG